MKTLNLLLIGLFWVCSCTGMAPGDNPYTMLGVNKDATQATIKKAYHTLSLKEHPDKHGNSTEAKEKFQKINDAHQILSDPVKRQAYDNQGAYAPSQKTAADIQREKEAYEQLNKERKKRANEHYNLELNGLNEAYLLELALVDMNIKHKYVMLLKQLELEKKQFNFEIKLAQEHIKQEQTLHNIDKKNEHFLKIETLNKQIEDFKNKSINMDKKYDDDLLELRKKEVVTLNQLEKKHQEAVAQLNEKYKKSDPTYTTHTSTSVPEDNDDIFKKINALLSTPNDQTNLTQVSNNLTFLIPTPIARRAKNYLADKSNPDKKAEWENEFKRITKEKLNDISNFISQMCTNQHCSTYEELQAWVNEKFKGNPGTDNGNINRSLTAGILVTQWAQNAIIAQIMNLAERAVSENKAFNSKSCNEYFRQLIPETNKIDQKARIALSIFFDTLSLKNNCKTHDEFQAWINQRFGSQTKEYLTTINNISQTKPAQSPLKDSLTSLQTKLGELKEKLKTLTKNLALLKSKLGT
jgi:curved DNA-binding protein CbpA